LAIFQKFVALFVPRAEPGEVRGARECANANRLQSLCLSSFPVDCESGCGEKSASGKGVASVAAAASAHLNIIQSRPNQ
jgi:hypothetical protein